MVDACDWTDVNEGVDYGVGEDFESHLQPLLYRFTRMCIELLLISHQAKYCPSSQTTDERGTYNPTQEMKIHGFLPGVLRITISKITVDIELQEEVFQHRQENGVSQHVRSIEKSWLYLFHNLSIDAPQVKYHHQSDRQVNQL